MSNLFFFQGISEETVPLKLTGKSESQFGISLSTIGDLNKDGYPGKNKFG